MGSMTGSATTYPLSSCTASTFTLDDDDKNDGNGYGMSAIAVIWVVFCILIFVTALFVIWRRRTRRLNGKAYFKETEDEQHAVMDSKHGQETEDTAMTVEVEVEINEEPITTTVTRD